MKMSDKTYASLKSDIVTFANGCGSTIDMSVDLATMWNLLNIITLQRAIEGDKTFTKRLLPYDGRGRNWLRSEGLEDTDIEVALKQIRKELASGK